MTRREIFRTSTVGQGGHPGLRSWAGRSPGSGLGLTQLSSGTPPLTCLLLQASKGQLSAFTFSCSPAHSKLCRQNKGKVITGPRTTASENTNCSWQTNLNSLYTFTQLKVQTRPCHLERQPAAIIVTYQSSPRNKRSCKEYKYQVRIFKATWNVLKVCILVNSQE